VLLISIFTQKESIKLEFIKSTTALVIIKDQILEIFVIILQNDYLNYYINLKNLLIIIKGNFLFLMIKKK
jgi:hypothetical protein